MLIPSPDPASAASAAAGAGNAQPVTPAAIAETVRRIKVRRLDAPSEDVTRKLVRQLQKHTAVLLQHDLGVDDEELKSIREGAGDCSALFPALLDEGSRAEAWPKVYLFAVVAEGLLRRWCQAETAGGDHEIRVEENEHGGYYVWDTVSGTRASLRNRQGRQPAAHMYLEAAWGLTRRLNQKAR